MWTLNIGHDDPKGFNSLKIAAKACDAPRLYELYLKFGGFLGFTVKHKRPQIGYDVCKILHDIPYDKRCSFVDNVIILRDMANFNISLARPISAKKYREDLLEYANAQGNFKAKEEAYFALAHSNLLFGNLYEARRMCDNALHFPSDYDNKDALYVKYHAFMGYIHCLIGDISKSLKHFEDGKVSLSSLSLDNKDMYLDHLGIWHTNVLRSIGLDKKASYRNKEATAETDKRFGFELIFPQRHLELAALAKNSGDYESAREELKCAESYGKDIQGSERFQKNTCCMREFDILLADLESDKSNNELVSAKQKFREAVQVANEALSLARELNNSTAHAISLSMRARTWLYIGDVSNAKRDACTILYGLKGGKQISADEWETAKCNGKRTLPMQRGIFRKDIEGLYAVTHPYFGYKSGEASARQILAEALLLQVAQRLKKTSVLPTELAQCNNSIQALISQAKIELDASESIRAKIQDPRLKETKEVIQQLASGVLTKYPLKKMRVKNVC